MQKTNKKAFTLVELIVVITILAILGTIAFISLQGYSSTARNSKRVSDIVNVGKGLEIKKIKSGFYEFPENYQTFTGTLTKTLKQGILGNKVLTNIGVTTNVKDPLTEDDYTYSVYGEGEYYQIAYELENNIFSSNLNILNTINAEDTTKTIKIKGNYEIDPSLPSLIVIPETVTGSGIFDPEVCFILEGGENTLDTKISECIKKKDLNLRNFDEGLVGYWDMESITTDGKLKDLSGNENNLTFSGTMDNISSLTGGVLGKSRNFIDQNLLLIQTGSSNQIKSVSMIITPYIINGVYKTIMQFNGGGLGIVFLSRFTSGDIYFDFDGTSGNGNEKKFGKIIDINNTYMITSVYSDNKVNVYLNGKFLYNFESIFGNNGLTSINIGSGINLLTSYIGKIDEIKVYNKSLSEQEIKQQAKIAGF